MNPHNDLVRIKNNASSLHQPIVLVSGVFDILHTGHLRFLKEAKGTENFLVVAVLSDAFVKLRKGTTRPVFNEKERLEMILSLRTVDAAVILDKSGTEDLIRELCPASYMVGGDRKGRELHEQPILEKYGVAVTYADQYGDESTTRLIEKMKNL